MDGGSIYILVFPLVVIIIALFFCSKDKKDIKECLFIGGGLYAGLIFAFFICTPVFNFTIQSVIDSWAFISKFWLIPFALFVIFALFTIFRAVTIYNKEDV